MQLWTKGEDNEEHPDPDKGSVPDRKTASCLDPEIPGTGLQEWGVKGPTLVKRVSWNPAVMGNHGKRQRGTHSRCDGGGSAANRVRSLLPPILNNSKEVNRSTHM
jgi:hypothetical protein